MRRREIFIELTSLLDVILIMLFVLLTQARSQTTQALQTAEEEGARSAALEARVETLEEETAALREENGGLKRRLDSESLVLSYTRVLTLSVGEDRTILLEPEEGEPRRVPYRWEQESAAANRLHALLAEELRQSEGALFLVFRYDRGSIYRAEYEMIRRELSEMKLAARERELNLSILELDAPS